MEQFKVKRDNHILWGKRSVGQPWWGGMSPSFASSTGIMISCHGAESLGQLRITSILNLPSS